LHRRYAPLAALAWLTFALSGCGSTTGQTPTSGSSGAEPIPPGHPAPAQSIPPGSPTSAQFISRADAICAELQTEDHPLELRAEALGREASAASRGLLADLFEQSIALARSADAKLAALARPVAERAAIAELLTGYGSEAQDVTHLTSALREGEPSLQESSEAALKGMEQSDRALARSLGLKVCAQE
jgi:hypothetical protein